MKKIIKKITLIISLLLIPQTSFIHAKQSFFLENKVATACIVGAIGALSYPFYASKKIDPKVAANHKGDLSLKTKSSLIGGILSLLTYGILSLFNAESKKPTNEHPITPVKLIAKNDYCNEIMLSQDVLRDFPIDYYIANAPYATANALIPVRNKRIKTLKENYKNAHDGYSNTVQLYSTTKKLDIKKGYTTKFEVWNLDTFDAAKKLLSSKPAVLDMANEITPGGGPHYGCLAQEEQCCYRSPNLFTALVRAKQAICGANWFHHGDAKHNTPFITETGAVYVPKVKVIRKSEAEKYELSKPEDIFSVDVIVSAAYDLGGTKKSANYVAGTMEKIRTQLRVALLNGHDTLLLSAFGCGAFKNNSNEVSGFYKEVFNEPEFKGAFKLVVFSIFGGGDNYKTFKRILE